MKKVKQTKEKCPFNEREYPPCDICVKNGRETKEKWEDEYIILHSGCLIRKDRLKGGMIFGRKETLKSLKELLQSQRKELAEKIGKLPDKNAEYDVKIEEEMSKTQREKTMFVAGFLQCKKDIIKLISDTTL